MKAICVDCGCEFESEHDVFEDLFGKEISSAFEPVCNACHSARKAHDINRGGRIADVDLSEWRND